MKQKAKRNDSSERLPQFFKGEIQLTHGVIEQLQCIQFKPHHCFNEINLREGFKRILYGLIYE
jgi:hypothetical protein